LGEEITLLKGGRTGTGTGTGGLNYQAADDTRQKFTSKERDTESNLDFFEARYFSAFQGRFTSPDEFTGGGPEDLLDPGDTVVNPTFYAVLSQPQSLNKYQYCYGNPLKYADLDGHQIPIDQVLQQVAESPAGQWVTENGDKVLIGAGAALTAAKVASTGFFSRVFDQAKSAVKAGLDAAANAHVGACPGISDGCSNELRIQQAQISEKRGETTPEKAKNLADADNKGIPRDQLGPSGKPKVNTVTHPTKNGRRTPRASEKMEVPGHQPTMSTRTKGATITTRRTRVVSGGKESRIYIMSTHNDQEEPDR